MRGKGSGPKRKPSAVGKTIHIDVHNGIHYPNINKFKLSKPSRGLLFLQCLSVFMSEIGVEIERPVDSPAHPFNKMDGPVAKFKVRAKSLQDAHEILWKKTKSPSKDETMKRLTYYGWTSDGYKNGFMSFSADIDGWNNGCWRLVVGQRPSIVKVQVDKKPEPYADTTIATAHPFHSSFSPPPLPPPSPPPPVLPLPRVMTIVKMEDSVMTDDKFQISVIKKEDLQDNSDLKLEDFKMKF